MQKWGGRQLDGNKGLYWKAEENGVSWHQTVKSSGSCGGESGVNILDAMKEEGGSEAVRPSLSPLASG